SPDDALPPPARVQGSWMAGSTRFMAESASFSRSLSPRGALTARHVSRWHDSWFFPSSASRPAMEKANDRPLVHLHWALVVSLIYLIVLGNPAAPVPAAHLLYVV